MDQDTVSGWVDGNSIRQDIFDLAGVRIALYYPQQKADVEQMIKSKFQWSTTKDHDQIAANNPAGYSPIFTGYRAKHYRVQLREEDTKPPLNSEDVIEIQVVSVLQHAWAEVHHDVLYKQLHGDASLGERRSLDGLNGVVQIGDLMLDGFHDLHVARIESENKHFSDKYELGSFLSKRLVQIAPNNSVRMGRVGILFKFLGLVERDTPRKLLSILEGLEKKGTNLSETAVAAAKKYGHEESTATIAIMDFVLSGISPLELLDITDGSDEKEKTFVQVLASTIITLDELFSPFFLWEKKFLAQRRTTKTKADLLWFIGSVSTIEMLSGESLPNDGERVRLRNLWSWFEGHADPAVQLVFGISKMGLLRDFPKEVARIAMLFPFLENLL
ncbi:hypothetical protein MMC08_006588 [Neofusicoccum parvum]|uniref:Uncharacterized protein n=1 Tax=Neofusicoccum parvum TaxID=310453 RepID=A0ACB5RT56_9PEZI|nr:hypothetical protein MMC08_006588 [Neofusicoccum parvum]